MLKTGDLEGALFPAVPVPFDLTGQIETEALTRYVEWMAGQEISGVAVSAHTGRGLLLDDDQRAGVIRAWRSGLPSHQLLIAAAGSRPGLAEPVQVLHSARRMAQQASDLGADALLVHPPTAFRASPDRNKLVQEYHAAVAEAGLPLILFFLYEKAGGISYEASVLTELLAWPCVLGIKVATLDSVMTFQDLASLIATRTPGKVLITGEDRFLGYSLMCGASAALIGMGAACTSLQAKLLRSYQERNLSRFHMLSRTVDDLSRHTFRAPMEGYIQRMLWCLVHHGILAPEAVHDPWGPPLDNSEFVELGKCLKRIEIAECEESTK
jgi:4-hydroxy-tetrahydrodipicolinate synthase